MHGHGWAITDVDGLSLYTYARDIEPGSSNCNADCAEDWPPYEASDEASPIGDWSIITRQDGSRQWAYADKPLYRYTVDEAPGDTYGEGVRALWALAFIELPTPPGIGIQKTLIGHVGSDRHGMTLYAPSEDVDFGELCVDDTCDSLWQPLVAPWAANALDDWNIVIRSDGIRQWAWQGRPLYTYGDDVHPRETSGEGVAMDDDTTATTLLLEPRPPYPDWIMVHETDAGQMLANLDGKTIYTYDPSRLRVRFDNFIGPKPCEENCIDPEWVPILAQAGEKAPGGNWAIFTQPDGSDQWAYKGRPLFTNTRDKTQGSFLGYRHGGSRAWNVIMHSEDALVGTLRPP